MTRWARRWVEARVVDKDSDASGTYRNARRVTSATRLWLAVGRSETAARATTTATQQLNLTVHGTVPISNSDSGHAPYVRLSVIHY